MAGPSGITDKQDIPFPTEDDDVNVPRDIEAVAQRMDVLGYVPPGATMLWLTDIAPFEWYLLDGQQIPEANNPTLAVMFGAVAGQVTLPNMKDKFPIMAGPTRGVRTVGGAEQVTLEKAQMPVHAHNIQTGGAHSHGGSTGWALQSHSHTISMEAVTLGSSGKSIMVLAGSGGFPGGHNTGLESANHYHGLTADAGHVHGVFNEGGGLPHPNMPPFFVVNFIIKAG
jgi:microcystin-dependent protein